MKIGIVSDSHGRANRLKAAVESLVRIGAEAIVHCGDIGSVECLEALSSAGVKTYAVAGNMDRHIDRLEETAAEHGVEFSCEIVEVPLEGRKKLVATHGHDDATLRGLIQGGQFPYVCHGHTHRARKETIGPTCVINPGALHNAAPHTAALLDTQDSSVRHISVP